MNQPRSRRLALTLGLFLSFFLVRPLQAQFLMDMVDTTREMGQGLLNIYRDFGNLRVSGYIQPQFQLASGAGAPSWIGGDFPPNVSNRFMLRRGRIRFDYLYFPKNDGPSVHFVFQFDGTERGVYIRDFWGRLFENKWKLFSMTTGMFARPFGFELNLSSADRESPERGRMSQILMRTERDLGVMFSLDARRPDHPLKQFKLDAGFFNGQGLQATTDFDNRKDFITRLSVKPWVISKSGMKLSGSVSWLHGAIIQNTPFVARTSNGQVWLDSSAANQGRYAPRQYYGADVQWTIPTKLGKTKLRAEIIRGTQTATDSTSETPAKLLTNREVYYRRPFQGAYFYFLQDVFSPKHQLGVKLDWYDPNRAVRGRDIAGNGDGFTAADIRFTTLGMGYTYYINEHIKLTLWYDRVWNERTRLPGFTQDVADNVLTTRLQYRF